MEVEKQFEKAGYEYCCISPDYTEYIKKDDKGIRVYKTGKVKIVDGDCICDIFCYDGFISPEEKKAIAMQLEEFQVKM
jgi:hypothetical protein